MGLYSESLQGANMTYTDGGNTGNEGNNWQQEVEGLTQTIFRIENICASLDQSTLIVKNSL